MHRVGMEGSTMGALFPTQQLDGSDLRVTRVGFGAWAIGGGGWSFGWGAEDDSDSIAAIRRALDLGLDWIDAADVQGLGDSDELDAGHLSPADRPYVFTKCGLIFDGGQRTREPRQSRWPDSMRQDCESSLRRLGIERIDLYQLQWQQETASVEESLSATMPGWGAHRTGILWYSPRQIDILTETFSQAPATASAVAVAWTLTSQGVAGAVVGASSADQIEGWIDAATLVLSRANLGEIATAIGRTGGGQRPRSSAALAA
jgi:aryl-alcohol dehydrogenase-like predicted oxidoreductase